jgi:hypothetical protein
MSILTDGSLAARLTDALAAADIPYDVVIQRTETDDDPFNPTTTVVDHAASGWSDSYDARDIDGTLIRQSDVKAFILCSSLDITPATTDKYVANSITYTIVSVQRDPAGACWIVQARA